MLNREFSLKLKLPPATVSDFNLVLCHCYLYGKALNWYSHKPGDLPNSAQKVYLSGERGKWLKFYHAI